MLGPCFPFWLRQLTERVASDEPSHVLLCERSFNYEERRWVVNRSGTRKRYWPPPWGCSVVADTSAHRCATSRKQPECTRAACTGRTTARSACSARHWTPITSWWSTAGSASTYARRRTRWPQIRAFFTSAFDANPGPEPDPGCLLTNTAVESFTVPQATAGVRRGLEMIESGFADALTRARAQQLLPSDIDVEMSATQLLTLYQGLLVLVRSGTAAAKLHAITDGALASIGARQAKTSKQAKNEEQR